MKGMDRPEGREAGGAGGVSTWVRAGAEAGADGAAGGVLISQRYCG